MKSRDDLENIRLQVQDRKHRIPFRKRIIETAELTKWSDQEVVDKSTSQDILIPRSQINSPLSCSALQVDPTLNVKEVMDTWTIQEGYPYINVSLTTVGDMTRVRATQERFMSDRSVPYNPGDSPFGYITMYYVKFDILNSSLSCISTGFRVVSCRICQCL